ncbi:hypothetical protein R4Y45_07115 [Holzapfeliella sp. He02]|uniref:Uncharacterized protein n=1 Tax=Holzapfeliella saturejae TaxID=3082953 RepID=A0ABU8SHW9_9LACO
MKKILTISQLPAVSLFGGITGLTAIELLLQQSNIDIASLFAVIIFISYPLLDFAVSCNVSRRQLVKISVKSVLLTSMTFLCLIIVYTLIFKCQFFVMGSKLVSFADYLYLYLLTVTAQLLSLVISMDSRLGYWSRGRRRGMVAIVVISIIVTILIHSLLSAIFDPIVLGIIISFLFFIIIRFLILKFAELVKAVDFTADSQAKAWIYNQEE